MAMKSSSRRTWQTPKIEQARDSALTFAAIWDPETGLEGYSGRDLFSPVLEDADAHARLSKKRNFMPVPMVENLGHYEPEEPHWPSYIEMRTSTALERHMREDIRMEFDNSTLASPIQSSSSDSSSGTDSSCSTPRSHRRLPPVNPSRANQVPTSVAVPSPDSKFTFAALWDPDSGLSAFKNGQAVKIPPSKKHHRWLSASTSNSNISRSLPSKSKQHMSQLTYGLDELDELKPGLYLPRSSTPVARRGYRSAIPSSNIEGRRDPWNDSCFDPLGPGLPFESRRAFSKFEGEMQAYHASPDPRLPSKLRMINPDESGDIDDEGFFEISAHPDCDPHLASRFSTTTTSTSTYVAIDIRSARPPTPVPSPESPFESPVPFPSSHTKDKSDTSTTHSSPKRNRLTRAKSFPEKTADGRQQKISIVPPVPRLSMFKKPWSNLKGSAQQDNQWVLVEVQSVVTDRLVQE